MYEDDARSFAVALYLDHGFSYEDIAFLLHDSRKYMGSRPSGGGGTSNGPAASTVREWVERFLGRGDVAPSAANADGAPVLDAAELAELRQHVETDPTMMLDELVYHVYRRTGKYVEVSSMCRILHGLGLSHKNVAERMLRGPDFNAGPGRQEEAFLQFQRRHFIQELVFFDETAAVERKLRRRKGWGAVGDDLYTYVPRVLLGDTRFVNNVDTNISKPSCVASHFVHHIQANIDYCMLLCAPRLFHIAHSEDTPHACASFHREYGGRCEHLNDILMGFSSQRRSPGLLRFLILVSARPKA